MGAPTWNPEDEDLADAERAEAALLERFLFSDPVLLDGQGRELGTPLRTLRGRLTPFLQMVTGLPIKLGQADPASTDAERIYLPLAAPAPPQASDERLYRVMALVQAGLWGAGLLSKDRTLKALYRDWVLRNCWHLLAARWVLQDYASRYPGLAADWEALRQSPKGSALRVNLTPVPWEGLPAAFAPLYRGLSHCPATGHDPVVQAAVDRVTSTAGASAAELVLLGQAQAVRQHLLKRRLGPPPLPWFLGVLRPEWILRELEDDPEYRNAWMKGPAPLQGLLSRGGRLEGPETSRRGIRERLRARLGRPSKKPEVDVGAMPAYGVLRDEAQDKLREQARRQHQLPDRPDPDEQAFHYDEWDAEAQGWRVEHAKVVEPSAPGGPEQAYWDIARAHAQEVNQIRRRFEALRTEERWVGGQIDGPEIDLDRAILARCDIAAGQQPERRLYRRFVRQPEPLCVMTLVDLSGSTQGRVLHAEQRALVLFAEGMRTLSLAHAFYGFNGESAGEVRLWRLKGFDEDYEPAVLGRMGRLRAQGATRLGAILRHATWRLRQRPEPRKLLLLLSDGRPEDRDGYRGERGIADSAMAVQEAHTAGVHLHCLSMDKDPQAGKAYLGRIFGPGRYLVLPKVEELAGRLPELFVSLV